MKSAFYLMAILFFGITFQSCEKLLGGAKLGGTVSPMGETGTTYSSTFAEIAGVSNFEASVVSVDDNVSIFSGSATVTNANIKSILSNAPQVTISGDRVTATNIKFKSTTEGIESIAGLDPGIIVKYDAKVGDTYTVTGTNKKRTVLSRSTDDDYPYGFYLIKVIKVEENTNSLGVKKITYWANHKFGLVGIEFQFDDGSTAKFPVYCSTNN
jgi:hypothetical protein